MSPDESQARYVLQMGECEAIAWEYAAIIEAGMDPAPMFGHPDRFNGEGLELVGMLKFGAHFGVHGLQAGGMTTTKTYPKMIRWMQE